MKSDRFRAWVSGLGMALVFASSVDAQPQCSPVEQPSDPHGSISMVTAIDEDTQSVRVRKPDSLLNGALIGAAVGGGLASLMFLDNECHDDPVCYKAVAVYAGIGALVGLSIDALIHGSVVVHPAAAPGARSVQTLAPIIARGRKGVQLKMAF